MTYNLVLAYRKMVGTGLRQDIKAAFQFYKENKLMRRVCFLLFAFFIVLCAVVYFCFTANYLLLGISYLFLVILIFLLDRLTVKRYDQFVGEKKERLDQTIELLKTIYPNKNLYKKKYVEELIERLSEYIKKHFEDPTDCAKNYSSGFVKLIVFPMVGFIVCGYSDEIYRLGFKVVASVGIELIFLLAIVYLGCLLLFPPLKRLVFRNYYYAEMLREDLQDILLLYFLDKE